LVNLLKLSLVTEGVQTMMTTDPSPPRWTVVHLHLEQQKRIEKGWMQAEIYEVEKENWLLISSGKESDQNRMLKLMLLEENLHHLR